MAGLLSKEAAETSVLTTRSLESLRHAQLVKLFTQLCTQLGTEQNSIDHMVTSLKLVAETDQVYLDVAKENLKKVQWERRPHRLYGCGLVNDGIHWVAKAKFGDDWLVGRGDCPAAALQDYDNQFEGQK
jgi:hypothetical protein